MIAIKAVLLAAFTLGQVSASEVEARAQRHYNEIARPVTFQDGQSNCGYDLNSWDGYQNWVAVPDYLGNYQCGRRITVQSWRGQSTATVVSIGTEDQRVLDVSERVWQELGFSYPQVRQARVNYTID
ncbi:unnamed protein product [Sympodiomycopsis kandeliae]